MTDDWEHVQTSQGDDWEPVTPAERPAPDVGEALPEAFVARVAQGSSFAKAIGGATDKLLGINGPRYQLWPERMIRSGLSLAGDVASGEVPQYEVDPDTGEVHTSQAMIQRAQDMAAFQLGQTHIEPTFSRAPLIDKGSGIYIRPHANPDGTLGGTTVGSLPTPADFETAGKVLDSANAPDNLRRMWQEDGIHPAEAVHDAERDAFLKNEITAKQEVISPPMVMENPVHGFHGSAEVISEFDPEQTRLGRGLFFAEKPNLASKFAAGEAVDNDPARIYGEDDPAEIKRWVEEHAGTSEANRIGAMIDKAEGLSWETQNEEKGAIESQVNKEIRKLSGLNQEYGPSSPNVTRARIDLGRSYEFDLGGKFDWDKEREAIDYAKSHGYDSVTFKNTGEDGKFYSVFDKNRIEMSPWGSEWNIKPEEMEAAFGQGASLSAAVTPPEAIPPAVQPTAPAGSLVASAQAAADKLFDIGRDIQMKLTPMARGSVDSMATVKDYMNAMRRNAWDSSRIDTDIVDRFSAEQRERMARAMEEESLSLRLGESPSAREHQGLATLEPEERAAVEQLDQAQQLAWLRARDLGMVEGDGIPMHFPRMAIGATGDTEIGKPPSLTQMYGIRKSTPYTKQRQYMESQETERALQAKYGPDAKIAWDIRAVNLATKMLEDAISGRTLIKNIQEVGRRTGDETVAEGFNPGDGWFTIDHPAFQKWRPKFQEVEGRIEAVKDQEGNTIFEQVPIYVRGDFEGPIRAALWGDTGAFYRGMMALKGKTMGLIMNSPAIHNLVEFGRAMPAMPGRMLQPTIADGGVISPIRMRVYGDGYRAKNDPGVMHEAINAGLVPIGKRFFNQDINAIMEAPDLAPGRSLTAKLAAAVPGLFDEAAGTAVKRAVDKMGDFWHNRLLWDKIADLQMGLYTNFRGDFIDKGMDTQTASRLAAHLANRYAGALPKEAMSEMATKVSNFMLFSRSFTFGNLGVMKDMLTGLPKDVLAQIERDAGFRAGSIDEAGNPNSVVDQAVSTAKSMARRKAIATVGLDIALMYAGNTVLQHAFNFLLGSSINEEEHGYFRRALEVWNTAQTHPLSLLNPFWLASIPGKLLPTAENEPGKGDRVLVGYAKDGTAIYGRSPIGKIGEEFSGYFGGPLDMLRKKEGTIARPLMQIYSNDAGFGRKVYDPNAETLADKGWAVWAIVKHLMMSQLPVGQLSAGWDLVRGQGDTKVNLLQALGPLAGFTFSKGAPGGPAVGVMYDNKSRQQFREQQAMPDLRRQIQRGDIAGAQKAMTELHMDPSYQRWIIKTTLNPRLRLSARSVRDFYRTASPEQRAQFERAQQAPQSP